MLYHGTSKEAAPAMLRDGIDINHPRKADPGDFGLGFYLTGLLVRAKACGRVILTVVIDDSEYAYIPNPYEPDDSEAGRLFKSLAFDENDNMLTCASCFSKEKRFAVSRQIREEFIAHGYKGIKSDYHDGEYVVFDLSTIKKMEIK